MVQAKTRSEPAARKTKTATQPLPSDSDQLIFTMRDNGGVVKVEKVDKAGVRGDLSNEECRRIAGEDEFDDIDSTFDAIFEFEDEIIEAIGDDDFLERLVVLRLLTHRIGRGVRAMRAKLLRRLLLRRLLRAALLNVNDKEGEPG